MNSTASTCPQCASPLPEHAPHGLCPQCLLGGAMTEPVAPPPDAELMTQVAAAFPQLELIELIGLGGMGRVYKARQPSLDRVIALKVLPGDKAHDPEWIERFTREARALARLNHPNIVQVHDFGTASIGGHEQPYLMMEFVDGVNLRQAMQAGALSAREALTIVPKLCDALQYAHEHDVLHRDIKPENVLIDSEGRVKLVDFGLAKLRDESHLSFTLTQSGTKLGTVAYMAPEQIEKPGEVDHRADIYSLGVVFYEMLTGELPLGRFPTPSEACGADARLDGVVMRTLEKNVTKRYQSAGEVKTGIETAQCRPSAPQADSLTRAVFINIASLALMPLATIYLAGNASLGLQLLVASCASILLGCGIVQLRQRAKGRPVSDLYPWRITAILGLAWALNTSGHSGWGLIGLGLALILSHFAVRDRPKSEAHSWFERLVVWSLCILNGLIGMLASGLVIGLARQATASYWAVPPSSLLLKCAGSALLFFPLWAAMAGFMRKWSRLNGEPKWWKGVHRVLAVIMAIAGLALIPHIDDWSPSRDTIRLPTTERSGDYDTRAGSKSADQSKDSEQSKMNKTAQAWYHADPAHWKALADEARRADSADAKNRAFNAMLEAIKSADVERVNTGLIAIGESSQVVADRTKLRDAIRNRLSHPNAQTRGYALRALASTNYDEIDIARVLALVPNATTQELGALAGAISTFSKKDYTGRYAAPMLAIIERGLKLVIERGPMTSPTKRKSPDEFDERDILNILWDAKWSPDIEKRIHEWCRLDESPDGLMDVHGRGYWAFYFALSVQGNMSTDTVNRLIQLMNHPDSTNIGGGCLGGFAGGRVAHQEDEPRVVSAVIELLQKRSDGYLWSQGLSVIDRYAKSADVSKLETLATLVVNDASPSERRDKLTKILERLKAKP